MSPLDFDNLPKTNEKNKEFRHLLKIGVCIENLRKKVFLLSLTAFSVLEFCQNPNLTTTQPQHNTTQPNLNIGLGLT